MNRLQWLYGTLIIIFLIVIGVSVYYFLGGFKEVEVYQLQGTHYTIAGRFFEGKYNHPVIEKYFEESRDLVNDSYIKGDLVVVNYDYDSANQVKLFIGILLDSDMAEIPRGFSVRSFDSETRMVVFLPMHPLVRPTSRKIEKLINRKSIEEDLELDEFTIEIYYPDESMVVERWVK